MEVASDENSMWEMPQTAVLVLFILVLLAAISLCASAVLKRKRFKPEAEAEDRAGQEPDIVLNQQKMTCSGWAAIRKITRGLVCWPKSRMQEKSERKDRQGMQQEIGGHEADMLETTTSPLWQRRILMGERCEMLRFSGLILYDEKGLPDDHLPQLSSNEQRKQMRTERTAAAGSTSAATLKDLL